MVISISKKNANSFKSSDGGIGLTVVHTFDLCISLGYETCLVAYNLTVFILLVPKHPFGSDDVVLVLGLLHECPQLVPVEVVDLFMHCVHPIRDFKSLFYLHGFNARDERIMLTKIS